MRKVCFMLIILSTYFFSATAQLAFRYDNVQYKALYFNQACRLMAQNPDYILLDVRSPGEYADTSAHEHMNMGRLKGAININIDSFEYHLDGLKKYSDKNIFVYCSHSHRSRSVSKFLADSGFKHVYNINGGMSLANLSSNDAFACKNLFFTSNNAYKNIASIDAYHLLVDNPDLMIIDIRDKKEFELSEITDQNIGRLKKAINIPKSKFDEQFSNMAVPKEKKILIYDMYGSESPDIAFALAKKGYSNVYNLFEGLAVLSADNETSSKLTRNIIEGAPKFKLISVKECIELLQTHHEFVVLDTRNETEFKNKADKTYLNLGHLNNAINISVSGLDNLVAQKNKETNFLVYTNFDQGSPNTAIDACNELVKKGFKNIYLMYPGLYSFVWSTFNVESCKAGKDFLTDHDGLY